MTGWPEGGHTGHRKQHNLITGRLTPRRIESASHLSFSKQFREPMTRLHTTTTFSIFPHVNKQIVRLVAGSDQFSGVGPAILPQWIFAPAHLQGLPTPGPTNGVGHRCFWKHPNGASGRTARSTTRACRDSASHHAPVEGTSTNANTSVVP